MMKRKSCLPLLDTNYLIFILSFLLILICYKPVVCQNEYKIEELFMEAEAWFYFQDYRTSLPLYIQVHEEFPENDNLHYKIGLCYLNINGQKDKAISFLEEASKNVTFNYTRESLFERQAPVDAIFYLGNAYLVNNFPEKALEAYNRFEKTIDNKSKFTLSNSNYDLNYLKKRKEACRTAQQMTPMPVSFTASNIGIPVNTPQSEYNPVISGDGKTMVFTAEKRFYTGVFMSKKTNSRWSEPINLLPQLGVDGDCETTSLSHDGKELYLYREDDLDGNLYVSHYEGGQWTKIQKLGPNINTEYWESHAFVTSDGNKLYFTSNREGGYGGLDIYISKRKADGTWGIAENIGKPVNTAWREDTPFLTQSGDKLFFSSEGHRNMGGLDLFVAEKAPSGNWLKPQNLGYPISTTDDDRFFVPLNNGNQGYYARYPTNPPGQKDIFLYTINNLNILDPIAVEGIMTYDSPTNKIKQDFSINIIDTLRNDTLARLQPDNKQKQYNYTFDREKNHLIFETPLLNNQNQYLISRDIQMKEHFLATAEEKEEKKEKQQEAPQITEDLPKIHLSDKIFDIQGNREQIKIKLNLEGGNKLIVNTFRNNERIDSEEFDINQEAFTYQFNPTENNTQLTFELFDKQENVQTKTLNINLDSLRASLSPAQDSAKLEILDKSYQFTDKGRTMQIQLTLEKGSHLTVTTYIDGKAVNKEEFDVDKEQFTYEFEPKQKKSRINFRVMDANQNIRNKTIVIAHEPIQKDLEELLAAAKEFGGAKLLEQIKNYSPQAMSLEKLMNSYAGESLPEELNKTLNTLLFALILNEDGTPLALYNKLLELADVPIKNYLMSMDTSNLESKAQLLNRLISASSSGTFSLSQLQALLEQYIQQSYPPDELYKTALRIAGMDLNDILAQLNASAVHMISKDDLFQYLQEAQTPLSDSLLAFLKSLDLSETQRKHKQFLAQQPQPGSEQQQADSMTKYVYILGGAAALALLIFLFLRSKKRKKQKHNKA